MTYETEMPNSSTQLFETAKKLKSDSRLATPSLLRTVIDITPKYSSEKMATRRKYRKVHLTGHEEHEPWREFQHLERRYFEPGDDFQLERIRHSDSMAICNDRRWPETYRCLALGGAEIILIDTTPPFTTHLTPRKTHWHLFTVNL